MMSYKGTTDFNFSRTDENDNEVDYSISVTYRYYLGCKETSYEPAEDPGVDILSMEPNIELTKEERDQLEQKILDEQ